VYLGREPFRWWQGKFSWQKFSWRAVRISTRRHQVILLLVRLNSWFRLTNLCHWRMDEGTTTASQFPYKITGPWVPQTLKKHFKVSYSKESPKLKVLSRVKYRQGEKKKREKLFLPSCRKLEQKLHIQFNWEIVRKFLVNGSIYSGWVISYVLMFKTWLIVTLASHISFLWPERLSLIIREREDIGKIAYLWNFTISGITLWHWRFLLAICREREREERKTQEEINNISSSYETQHRFKIMMFSCQEV
jgi:hypothetical protein